jgi:ion channel-forming bestrophin family protein
MVLISLYTIGITYVFQELEINFVTTTAVHSILGIVLGFFLVFRTNAAYDRWWEGRKVWGALINNSRNLSLKLSAILLANTEEKQSILNLIRIYPLVLKEHLREGVDAETTEKFKKEYNLPDLEHIPNAVAQKIFFQINDWKKKGLIDPEQYRVLDDQASALTDITGVCERIKNTPTPYSYVMFMKKFIFVFMITLPFAFIELFGYWTIGVVVLLLYVLLSIELLAEEIEDPFGRDTNDLPTDHLSNVIGKNVDEILSK